MKRERALQVVLVLVGLFYCFWGCCVDRPQTYLEKCDTSAGVNYVHFGGWIVASTTSRLTAPGADKER
jgi:hypothetical protein